MNRNNLATNETPLSAESPPPDTFAVDDPQSANWLVRRIVEARNYAEHVKAWADAEVRRAENEEKFLHDRYGRQLEEWARAEVAHGRRKCVKLPSGAVGFRTEPPKLNVTDEERLIRWCERTLSQALVMKTSVLKAVVKEHAQATGECLDGAEISGGGERFYIR